MIYDQIHNPIKNDWFSVVSQNLIELGMDHYSLKDIKEMKKYKVKNLVKAACQDTAFKELNVNESLETVYRKSVLKVYGKSLYKKLKDNCIKSV